MSTGVPWGYLVHSACEREEEGVGRGLESSLKEKNRLEVMTGWELEDGRPW